MIRLLNAEYCICVPLSCFPARLITPMLILVPLELGLPETLSIKEIFVSKKYATAFCSCYVCSFCAVGFHVVPAFYLNLYVVYLF